MGTEIPQCGNEHEFISRDAETTTWATFSCGDTVLAKMTWPKTEPELAWKMRCFLQTEVLEHKLEHLRNAYRELATRHA